MGLGKGNTQKTSEVHALKVTTSEFGMAIPLMWGRGRLQLMLLWTGDFKATQQNVGGKGLGKSGGSQYDYVAAILGALCQGPLSGIGNIWAQNGRLTLQSVSEQYTVPVGGGTIAVANASRYASDNGVAQHQPYNYTANDYGAPGPFHLTGVTPMALAPVSGSPGANQYSASGGVYAFNSANQGQTITINYSFSLYTLEASEDFNIPNYPYEVGVEYQAYYQQDLGVIFVDTGVPLQQVSGSPSAGQYSVDNGNYFFSAADVGRPIVINYKWIQSSSNVDPASTLQFTLIEGTLGQAAWDYLISKHLSQALGYSGIALIAAPAIDLGPEAMLPNYNYEVLGQFSFGGLNVDADMALVIQDFMQNQIYGCQYTGPIDDSLLTITREYWAANGFFGSPILDTAQPAAQTIDKWCEAGNVGDYWSEGKPKFIPYGDTSQVGNGYLFTPQTHPVVDLNDDDFMSDPSEDPVQIARTEWEDAFNEVKIQYINRLNNYNASSIIEQDDWAISLYGTRPEGQQDYSFLCTQAAAQFAANIRLKRNVYIRKQYTFKISALRYDFLEVMDLVTLTDVALGLNKEPVRIKDIDEDENRIYTITAEEFPWGTATATIYTKQGAMPPSPSPGQADPMNTVVEDLFEPPTRVATSVANSGNQVWAALTGGPNWGGCQVWFSKDNQNFEMLGVQNGTSRAGVITANLPSASDPDTTNTLSITITGELFNVTRQAADAFATISKVGSEYISFENCILTGSKGLLNSYDLTYLRRGVFSTPDISHAANDPTENAFVRIDNQLYKYSYDPSLAGQTVYFKFPAFNTLGNRQQSLSDVISYPITLGGSNTSQNMTIDSILNMDGTDCTIRLYKYGSAPGTDGSVTLPNNAFVTLPAHSETPSLCSTLYYVNFNLSTASYVFYTDQNQWLSDQHANNYLSIGTVQTVAASGPGGVYLPLSFNDTSDGWNPAVNPSGPTQGGSGSCVITAYANNPMTVPAFASGGVMYSNWINGVPSVSNVRVQGDLSVTGDSNLGQVLISVDNGHTFVPVFNTDVAQHFNVTLPVPPGTNLSSILVWCAVQSSSSTAYSTCVLTIGSVEVD